MQQLLLLLKQQAAKHYKAVHSLHPLWDGGIVLGNKKKGSACGGLSNSLIIMI